MSGELHDISEAIGRLRSDVAHLHQCVHDVGVRMDGRCDRIEDKVDKLGGDVTADKADLATFKTRWTAIASVAGLVAGYLATLVKPLLGRLFGN